MLKYLSLFTGIGAFEKALTNLGIKYDLVGYSEIDKYASKSYSAIHNVSESLNLGDITKIDETEIEEVDLITYGFPCQDISLAGKQKGLFNEDGTQTRSGLFFDALRVIEHTQPKVAIAENVKNLTSKKFSEQFNIVLDGLTAAGYNNYWQVLNAKDYGIPQNRERVFIISIRKDVDTGIFEFPEPYELKLRLKDKLEDTVDEKYYLNNDRIDSLIKNTMLCATDFSETTTAQLAKNGSGDKFSSIEDASLKNVGSDCALTITSRYWKGVSAVGDNVVIQVGNVNPSGKGQNGTVVDSEGIARTITIEKGEGQKVLVSERTDTIRQIANVHPTSTRANPNQGRVYDPDYIAPALHCMGGGNLEPHVVVKENNRVVEPMIAASRGRNPNNPSDRSPGCHMEQRLEVNVKGVCNTLTTVQKDNLVIQQLRIRKLTPKECFRLMGFDDCDHAKAEKVNSNTQLYKQAGNSIVVDVAEELLCMIFDEYDELYI